VLLNVWQSSGSKAPARSPVNSNGVLQLPAETWTPYTPRISIFKLGA